MLAQRQAFIKVTLGSVFILAMLFLLQNSAFAADAKDLKGISEIVSDQIRAIANLLVVVAYVAGVGFMLAGIVQFKAHKDTPTQVPLSKPIVLLSVGACLLFLPTIMKAAGTSVLGDDKASGADTKIGDGLN